VVKRIGKQLIIAAQVDVPDMPYYQEIKSLIDEKQIVYIGEVNTQEKVAYLQKASALISPIQWEEPFGLVAIEAMSCGTPVLGMGRGAYPEIIEQGKQGFLATTVDELTEYAKQIEQIDRHACRTRVEQFFTVEKMADGYEQVYKKLLE